MVVVLGIEQDYDLATRYCQAFRKRFVYSHSVFGEDSSHTLIECFGASANLANIDDSIGSAEFITGSGHGEYDRFTGQHGVTIWVAATLPANHANRKIVHLLSCQTGGLLGLEFVKKGARAFWGYTVDFIFYCASPPPKEIQRDGTAEIFFRMDAIIDRGILSGRDGNEIYQSLTDYFWRVYVELQAKDPKVADALLDDFVHIASPALNWGDAAATL